jgi:O-antigen ligase
MALKTLASRFNKLKISEIKPLSLSGFFLKVFLVIFPFQIQTLIFRSDVFSGQFNLFSSVFLNLSEVVLWLALFFYALYLILGGKIKNKILNVQNFAVTLYFAAGIISVFWSMDKVFSLMLVLKGLELLIMYFLLAERILSKVEIIRYLMIGGLIQVLIGFGQYVKQGSLGLTFLGEPNLDAGILNVAKINLAGEKLVRAYGTFPHANVFGGYMVFLLGILCIDIKKENLYKKIPLIMAFLFGLLISFSRTAWLAGFGFLVILVSQQSVKINWKYLILGIATLIFILVLFNLHTVILARITDISNDSYSERALFAEIGQRIFFKYPMGVGLGNFVSGMAAFSNYPLQPWLFQPVHNIFMLAFIEQGIVGGLLYIGLFVASAKLCFSAMKRLLKMEKYQWKVWLACLFIVVILGMFDHYLYTIWSGQVILFVLFALINLSWQERKEMNLAK